MPAVHIKTIRVEEDSIDVHGHVNNQEYLRWMQEAAIEHSTRQAWPMERYLELGASWYVRSHFIEYLTPALLADEILACTWIAGMDSRRCTRKTVLLRRADRRMLARAETQWIFVNLTSAQPFSVGRFLLRFPHTTRASAPFCVCHVSRDHAT